MLNVSNYIYTENGILSVNDLLSLQESGLPLPNVLTFDTDNLMYKFTPIDTLVENTDTDIYEVRFIDVFSNRNIIINVTLDTEIFQYNIIRTDNYSIFNKHYQILRYLKANIDRSTLNMRWAPISSLPNYATKSPNLCLGDTLVKFSAKIYKNKEVSYDIRYNNTKVPVFATLTKSTIFNFILLR